MGCDHGDEPQHQLQDCTWYAQLPWRTRDVPRDVPEIWIQTQSCLSSKCCLHFPANRMIPGRTFISCHWGAYPLVNVYDKLWTMDKSPLLWKKSTANIYEWPFSSSHTPSHYHRPQDFHCTQELIWCGCPFCGLLSIRRVSVVWLASRDFQRHIAGHRRPGGAGTIETDSLWSFLDAENQ